MSPAYDLLPTALLLPEDNDETALRLNGKKRKVELKDFRVFAKRLQLNEKQTDNVLERFSSNLAHAYSLLEHGLCSPKTKQRYAHILNERSTRLEMS